MPYLVHFTLLTCATQRSLHLPALIAVCLMLSGCIEEPASVDSPPVRTAADEPPAARPGQTSEISSSSREIDGLKWSIPKGWQEQELSSMQMGIISARFAMPETAPDVTLTLSRSGGSIDENLDRWRGQVTESEPEKLEVIRVAGLDATLIDLKGRFSPGMGRPPQDGGRMLGVIVPLPDRGYFLKLTGPAQQVDNVETEFREMLFSATK